MQQVRQMPKGGRPPGTNTIRATAAQHAKDAVAALADVARDAGAPADARVKAAETLLAYSTAAQGA